MTTNIIITVPDHVKRVYWKKEIPSSGFVADFSIVDEGFVLAGQEHRIAIWDDQRITIVENR